VDLRFLAQQPLFNNLPQPELERLAATLRSVNLPPGAVLFREGERGDHFYVVLDGELEVLRALGTAEELFIAVRGAGEFIGELSLMNPDGLRTASIRARGPTRLWEMTRDDFDGLIQRQPSFAYELLRVMGTRLTAAHTSAMEDLRVKNLELREAYRQLQAAQAQIIEKERLERELEVAYDIQMSVLSQTLPELPGYDFGAMIVPARSVGGDFYDLLPLGPDLLAVAIGDVTDKGVPAAIFMAEIHALLHASAIPDSKPAQVLQRVNQQLLAIGESPLFATVVYGLLDRATGEFAYARAGHEPPLLVTAEGRARPLPWSTGQPLGLFPDPAIDERTVIIPPGGTLLLYTDGITDGRSPDGEIFRRERLAETMGALATLPAQTVCDRLWQRLVDFQEETPQQDDVTLVALHRQPDA
jgi:sigma-B regulation protein RsbU (phosphoserine phosphatase)